MVTEPVEASVILPAFNGAMHIEAQLQALAAQRTDVRWELIVSDNGSTDGTLAIVERTARRISAPVRVVDASARRGTASARNAGAAAAVGEHLLFTDQDDVVDPLWVQEMVRALRADPFVGGRREFLELNGQEVGSWRVPSGVDSLPLWNGVPYAIGCNCGCTAAVFAAVGGFDETFVAGGEDIDLSLRLHARGTTAVFAQRALVHYRCHRRPWWTVRQTWAYGRSNGRLYRIHGGEPPTFLDLLVGSYRHLKRGLRRRLTGRRTVREVAELAYELGEASRLWREPAFWRPVTTRRSVANPLLVQRERAGRLAGLLRRRIRRAM